MKINKYLRDICTSVKYPGIWIILELQTNLQFIIGKKLAKFIKPVQIRINKIQKNILVCWVHPMMLFQIKANVNLIKQSFNIYIGKKLIYDLLLIVKSY